MKNTYFRLIPMVEKLYRTHLRVMKNELNRIGALDITDSQAVILCNIGNQNLTVGQISDSGCFMGSNVTYLLKIMVKNKYLVQEQSVNDHRCSKIRLSDKGIELRDKLDSVLERYSHKILDCCISSKNIMKEIGELEHFWSQLLKNKRGHQYGT